MWKTLWKMFITHCTRKLLWNLCELVEQKFDGEGYRSHWFSSGNFAKFVEFSGRDGPPQGASPAGPPVCSAYLPSHRAKRPAKNTSGYRTDVLSRAGTDIPSVSPDLAARS